MFNPPSITNDSSDNANDLHAITIRSALHRTGKNMSESNAHSTPRHEEGVVAVSGRDERRSDGDGTPETLDATDGNGNNRRDGGDRSSGVFHRDAEKGDDHSESGTRENSNGEKYRSGDYAREEKACDGESGTFRKDENGEKYRSGDYAREEKACDGESGTFRKDENGEKYRSGEGESGTFRKDVNGEKFRSGDYARERGEKAFDGENGTFRRDENDYDDGSFHARRHACSGETCFCKTMTITGLYPEDSTSARRAQLVMFESDDTPPATSPAPRSVCANMKNYVSRILDCLWLAVFLP